MKILHTADWHLGQTFYEYDRREEHLHFLEWLKQQIRQHEIDVLLIAGDVFDSPNPSAESQRMYYRFLREVTSENPSLQIIIIAGNHDSAARLEAPNPLLEDMNVTVRGVVRVELVCPRVVCPFPCPCTPSCCPICPGLPRTAWTDGDALWA